MTTLVKEDAPGLNGGIERLSKFFENRASRPGLLARRALNREQKTDQGLRKRLVQELRGETRLDGSVGGAVVPTIWRVIELIQLGHGDDQAGTIRVMGWVLTLQELPGAYGEGCTDQRHAHKVCEHYVGGFFSPAPPTQRLSPVTLPIGNVYRSESAARFATSCLALRAALMAGFERRPGVQRHMASLVQLQDEFTDWHDYFAPDMIIAALSALAMAPPPYREALPNAAAFIARHQQKDGAWPNADLFHTLDALVAAGTPEARRAVRKAVPLLLKRQRPDGAFGAAAQEERALVALRALLWVRS
jgi:hypothetical protein